MIPLSANEIASMWTALKEHDFESTHGAFVGTEISSGSGGSRSVVKKRVLESMQVQVRRMGWANHAILKEEI